MKKAIIRILKCTHDQDLNTGEVYSSLKEFCEKRDWNQFHNPNSLANSSSIESGELLECVHWNSNFIGSEKSVWWF